MFEFIPLIQEWQNKKIGFAITTVIRTWGSAPRKTGSMMIVNELGEFSGSVSGGCVETAVIQESIEVIKTKGSKLLNYGVSNDTAWELGLACGGNIEVFCQYFTKEYNDIFKSISINKDVSFSVFISKDSKKSGVINIDQVLNHNIFDEIQNDHSIIFHNAILQPFRLLIVGGVQIAQILASLAHRIGYETIVIDPRKAFISPSRFPNSKLINSWPDEAFLDLELTTNTALISLSHNPAIDDPALVTALDSPCFYVGSLGSKKTQVERKSRIIKSLKDKTNLERLKGPAGLEISADTPEEIAVSILSEIIKEGHNR